MPTLTNEIIVETPSLGTTRMYEYQYCYAKAIFIGGATNMAIDMITTNPLPIAKLSHQLCTLGN